MNFQDVNTKPRRGQLRHLNNSSSVTVHRAAQQHAGRDKRKSQSWRGNMKYVAVGERSQEKRSGDNISKKLVGRYSHTVASKQCYLKTHEH